MQSCCTPHTVKTRLFRLYLMHIEAEMGALSSQGRTLKAPAARASPHCTLPSPRLSRAQQPPYPQMDNHMIPAFPVMLSAASWCRLSTQGSSGGASHGQYVSLRTLGRLDSVSMTEHLSAMFGRLRRGIYKYAARLPSTLLFSSTGS